MLDNETKRRIDTARDILVGKVPDPKSQVEQITIALIYKFMDDMDAESEEFGGSRSFFTGKFAKYGWNKLMHSGLGGHEMLNLYSEGISRLPENPGIPPLFRDIFKNAYLPYRDPETLRAFLKVIDDFTYDHSERLGDAFEYLLSVLGSQGDAGQFRTPRHIIDFMVEVINPQKGDKILDPACGTAGFLISSYKHILKNNTDKKGHSSLTPDEKGKLAKNFTGYDISPDMVRLSLVNMYLHGFAEPHIYEYDTLTSQDRWNEYVDVILANPPFMSPKGGIKPHTRFSVQSKRSEVLFVDYMAEHLTPTGRAAIIVPEGIIFQSQTAYKQLRELLVNEHLVAVVSLPAGVFQPYSGVKTSILIMDRALAKKSDSIAFFKVENDGFGLGAQRRPIDKNDLPQVQIEIADYLYHLRSGKPVSDMQLSLGLIVNKEKIAVNGEYSLSGERYRVFDSTSSVFPILTLSEISTKITDGTHATPDYKDCGVPFLRVTDITESNASKKFISREAHLDLTKRCNPEKGDVLYSKNGTIGVAKLVDWDWEFSIFVSLALIKPRHEIVDSAYLTHFLNSAFAYSQATARSKSGTVTNLHLVDIKTIRVPVPPLETQKEIVAEIEGYQKVIDGARAVIDNYRPHIPIDPNWSMVRLVDVCETITDGDHQPPPKSPNGVPFVTISNINEKQELDFTKTFFVPEAYYANIGETRKPKAGDVLYTVTGSYGIPVLVLENIKFCFQRHIALIRTGPELYNRFLFTLLLSPFMLKQGHEAATGVAQKTVSLSSLRNFNIPLPPISTQRAIVEEIEAEQALVNANRELITRMEKKIQATLARVWGDSKESQSND